MAVKRGMAPGVKMAPRRSVTDSEETSGRFKSFSASFHDQFWSDLGQRRLPECAPFTRTRPRMRWRRMRGREATLDDEGRDGVSTDSGLITARPGTNAWMPFGSMPRRIVFQPRAKWESHRTPAGGASG
ncbi:hypothetical protein HDU96_004739, partial [Phlyctochytrium bullatum]